MSANLKSSLEIITDARSILAACNQILRSVPLTRSQREDFEAIHEAAAGFVAYADDNADIIDGADAVARAAVRHDLRNYLNIIVGFSQLTIRQLPDNLLLHMIMIRDIHTTAEDLQQQVDAIQ